MPQLYKRHYYYITQAYTLTVSGSSTNVLCYGDANGSITINGAGGTPGYTMPMALMLTPPLILLWLAAGVITIIPKMHMPVSKDTVIQ